MKLSDLAVCAIRLYALFSFIEVLKQLLDTVIFIGMLPAIQLVLPVMVNVIEFILLIILFVYSPRLTASIINDREAKNLTDRLFRLYTVKAALYITSVIIVFRSLTSILVTLSANMTKMSETESSSLHGALSLSGPAILGSVCFIVLGIAMFLAAVRIREAK